MRSFCPSASLAKSLMMLFLAVMLICVHTAALAAETQPEMAMTVVEETVIPSHAKADNDALFEEYVSSLFYPRFVSKDLNLGGRLEGNEAVLYRLMKASAEKIAAGESASTQLSYPIADVLETTTFTPEDLGVAELLDASGQPTSEVVSKLQAYIAVNQQTLLDALVYDLPYDLYWFDKEEGMAGSTSYGFSWYSDGSAIMINGSFNFSLAVAGAYQDGELYRFNTALASNAKTAASNAKALVTANAGNNDLTKLKNYKNAICNYVSYNQTAVDNKAAYGNPWQLVWVFDNDPETNVVCEGYSKAFEYLCNQTNFAGDIKVYCVTGDMQTNAAPGPHMWNMVAMDDGANYLVDVTNCDTDTWGYPDQLFMAYSTVGTASVSYRISTTEGYVTYSYDTSTRSSYTADELLLADSAYTGSTKNVAVNAENFPDAAFRTYVLDQLDPNADGYLTPAEMAQITDIDVSSMGIKTLKGIEYFCNLTNLRCSNNELTQLDLTPYPNLDALYCSNNQLTQLELTGRDLTYCNVGTQYASNVLVINRGKNGYTIDLAPLKLDMDRVEVYNSDCWEVSPGVVGFAYQPDDLVYVWDTGLEDQEMEVVCQLSHLLDIDDPLPETTEGTRVPVKVYLSCGHSHPQALLYNGSSVVSVYSCVDDEYYDITLPVTQPGIQEFTVAATSGIPCRVSFTLITHAENKLTLPGKLDLIEEEAFAGLNIREVIVPEGVTDIGKNAFANCGKLALVTLPDSLESISNTAFDGCENLVILCAEDSTAHVFAQANNIRFLLK